MGAAELGPRVASGPGPHLPSTFSQGRLQLAAAGGRCWSCARCVCCAPRSPRSRPRAVPAAPQVLELQRRVQGTPFANQLQIIHGDVMKVGRGMGDWL